MLMVVLVENDKQFAVSIGPTKLTPTELALKWPELIEKINRNEVSSEELDGVWSNSFIFMNKVDAVAALLLKGFNPPYNLN